MSALPDAIGLVPLEWVMLILAAAFRVPLRVVSDVDDVTDDRALIERVARGDPHSAAHLYQRLEPLVRRTVRRLSSRAVDHDDLVQQTFVELLISLKGRPVIRSLEAWAATLAARTVYQRLRRARLEQRFAAPPSIDEHTGSTSSAPPLAERRDLIRRIAGHLEGLNANRAQVYVLHDVHGFELKEIAEILGITVANAQSRLVRGRADLRERIARDVELARLLTEGFES